MIGLGVRRLALAGFMTHVDTSVELPGRGIVLVVGPNGGGKSSLVEGVAFAGWGKTLRGTPPISGGEGRARLEAGELQISRAQVGDRKKLEWSIGGEASEFENLTKAQEALAKVVGSFSVWRRSAVFSSSDAAHFTMASDGERKRLLEVVLGVGGFDAAAREVRSDIRVAEAALAVAEQAERAALAMADVAFRHVNEARELLATMRVVEAEAGPESAGQLRAVAEVERRRLTLLAQEVRKLDLSSGEAAQARREAARRIKVLEQARCSECGQGIPPGERAAATARLQAQLMESNVAERVRAGTRADLEAEQRAAAEACRAADGAAAGAQEAARRAAEDARRRGVLEQQLAAARQALARAEEELDQVAAARAAAGAQATLLGAVERVLGLRGARAHILGRALTGLTAAANVWLGKLSDRGLRVVLRPYEEKASGGVTDALALEVVGAGGGHGYAGASAGERRRIDIAIMLALAEVGAAAQGVRPGTLFFDEVFDGLDADGYPRACAVLEELARSRCVVVISHSAALGEMLKVDLLLEVDGGRVSQGRVSQGRVA